MPQGYTCSFGVTSITSASAQDLFVLSNASSKVAIVNSILIGNSNLKSTSDSDMLMVKVQRASGAGSGGSAQTEEKLEPGFAAAAAAVVSGNTSTATLSGSALITDTFNILSGWAYTPALHERIVIPPSGHVVCFLGANPTASTDLRCTVNWEEHG